MENEYVEPGSINKTITQANQTAANIAANPQRCRLFIANDTDCLVAFDKDNTAIKANISGGGTINNIPKFTAGKIIGDSRITDDGSVIMTMGPVGIGSATPPAGYGLYVEGDCGVTEDLTVWGRAGIGITNPTNPGLTLDILDAGFTMDDIVRIRTNNLTQGIGIYYGGIRKLTTNNEGALSIDATTNDPLLLQSVNPGKIGIGITNPTSILHVLTLSEYADNAAAVAAGHTAGAFYRTGDVVKVVHA